MSETNKKSYLITLTHKQYIYFYVLSIRHYNDVYQKMKKLHIQIDDFF